MCSCKCFYRGSLATYYPYLHTYVRTYYMNRRTLNFFPLFFSPVFSSVAKVSRVRRLTRMLTLLALGAPRPDVAAHAGQLQTTTGCISLATDSEVVDDAWCDENCAATPDYEGCIGMCQCPQVAVDRSESQLNEIYYGAIGDRV